MEKQGLINKLKSIDFQITSFEVEIKSKKEYLRYLKKEKQHIKNLLNNFNQT